MSTRLFEDRYYFGEGAQAEYDADKLARAGLVRQLIETGPGRLSADEVMVLAWYREAKTRVDPQYSGHHVDVLLVGNPGTVGVVNHQLDHIDGGLSSIMQGVDVAHGCVADRFSEGGFMTPPPLFRFGVVANRLSAHEIAHEGMVWGHEGLSRLEDGK